MGFRGYSELRRGLVLHLPMSEGAGTVVRDTSQYRNNGVFGAAGAAPTWVEGVEGRRAVSFDGIDHYISIPDSASLDITGDMSIFCKMYIDAYSENEGPLRKFETYGIRLKSSGRAQIWLYGRDDGSGNEFTKNMEVGLSTGRWLDFAITVDGSTVRTYLNAQLKDTDTMTGATDITTDDLILGSYGGAYLNYKLGDFRMYNRALDAIELRNLGNLKGLI